MPLFPFRENYTHYNGTYVLEVDKLYFKEDKEMYKVVKIIVGVITGILVTLGGLYVIFRKNKDVEED